MPSTTSVAWPSMERETPFVAGVSGFGGPAGEVVVVIKLDGTGKPLWTRTYEAPVHGHDPRPLLALDGRGSAHLTVPVVGRSGLLDALILRYSSGGDLRWERRFEGPRHEDPRKTGVFPRAIAVDPAGDVLVAADLGAPLPWREWEATGLILLKCDATGGLRWTADHSGLVRAMAVDGDGNAYLAGSTSDRGDGDALTLKLDSQGRLEWVATSDGPARGDDAAVAIAIDPSGGVVVAGHFDLWTSSKAFTIKYDASGRELWRAVLEGRPTAVAVDSRGSIYVTGWTAPGTAPFRGQFIARYASTGKELWTRLTPGHPEAGIVLDRAGNVYVSGHESASGLDLGWASFTTVIGPDGDELSSITGWKRWVRALALDREDNLHLAGMVNTSRTLPDQIPSDLEVARYPFLPGLPAFLRGDCNGSGRVNLADPVALLRHLFQGAPAPRCLEACDADGDGQPGSFLTDAIYLLQYSFLRGAPPPPPFPYCGVDPSGPGVGCALPPGC